MEEFNGRDVTLHAIKSRTIRELVEKTNELCIQKEDIVAVLPESGFYVLLYYFKDL